MLTPIGEALPVERVQQGDESARLAQAVGSYLEAVCLLADEAIRATLPARLCQALMQGVDDTGQHLIGLCDPEFAAAPAHANALRHWISLWLADQQVVFPGFEAAAADAILACAQSALDSTARDGRAASTVTASTQAPSAPPKIIDLAQCPDVEPPRQQPAASEDVPLRQLALF